MDDLRRRVAEINWFHSIDLGNGLVTPGWDDSPLRLAQMGIPADLTGTTVLDVGAWDGYFSFEAERRGADRVLAVDSFSWEGEGWGSKAGFELAHEALGSRVESKAIDVLDLSPETVGVFDLVLFLGVLYHMRDPLLALERVASVTGGHLVLDTRRPDPPRGPPPPSWRRDEPRRLELVGPEPGGGGGDARAVGFERVEIVQRPRLPSLGRPRATAQAVGARSLRRAVSYGRPPLTHFAANRPARARPPRFP